MNNEKEPKIKRTRLSQSEVPAYSLEQALRIPRAINDNYAGQPTIPLRIASAMAVQPTSSSFRQLCGAAIAYELTEGGYNAAEIKLTALGKRIVRPTSEGGDLAAKREALLKPRVINEFLTKYNGSQLPKDNIAQNVLNDFGVPPDRSSEVLALIVESAEALGLITEIKEKRYVDLDGVQLSNNISEREDNVAKEQTENNDKKIFLSPEPSKPSASMLDPDSQRFRKVFITHGKNKEFVEPIKKLLAFGEMEPVVS